MVITVEDDPHALIELLWIREAWNLRPVGDDLPPLLSDASVGASSAAHSSARIGPWQEAWPDIWAACLHHAGHLQDADLFERIRETENGSTERADLLHRLVGPTWRDAFGDEALVEGYQAWNLANFEARSRRQPQPWDESPERISLAALIPAWRFGLTKVVIVPCTGTFTRVIGRHSLLMTAGTRDDPGRYSEALTQFH